MSVTHKCESKNTGVNLKHMSVNKMPDKYFNMLVVEHVC